MGYSHWNFRIFEHNEGTEDVGLMVIEVYYDEDGAIIATSDPDTGSKGPTGSDVDELRAQIARLSQALESPILHAHNLPGHPDFVDVDERQALRSSGSPVEAFDDGSAPEGPDDEPVEGGDEPGQDAAPFEAGPEGDPEGEVEPDPDARHDDA